MALFILPEMLNNRVWGYDKSIYIAIFTVIYISYVLYTFSLNYYYFSFNDDGDKLIFKFISLRPFYNKKMAIEIPKIDFKGYKFKMSFLNLKQELILTVKTKNGIASYPPISITALSLKHKKILERALNQLV